MLPSWTLTSINRNSEWTGNNDPCGIELGLGWCVPTYTEWTNVDTIGDWTDWNGPWNSVLKIHAAGYLASSNGSLNNRGSYGFYWSSSQFNNIYGKDLDFSSDYCQVYNYGTKANGFTIRCLNEDGTIGLNSNFSAIPLEGQAPLNVQFTDELHR